MGLVPSNFGYPFNAIPVYDFSHTLCRRRFWNGYHLLLQTSLLGYEKKGSKAMKKRLAVILPLFVILLLALPTEATATPPVESWESYTTGADSDYEVYGNEWVSQTFTITPESHSIKQVRILAYREGEPGTVTISIKETDLSGLPIGDDLTSGTFDGDTITNSTSGAWYGVVFTEDSLSYDETYAIVIRAEAGDADNSLHVRYDGSTPSYTGGSIVTSSNAGITWVADTDSDILFEVQGCGLLEVSDVKVFRGYAETNDLLFAISYLNTYVPYYPLGEASADFFVQLRNAGGGTILSQTVCQAWGYKPAFIYLNANQAASITNGGSYRIYIKGNMDEAPYEFYTLSGSDWRGTDLKLLDSWVISLAKGMADYYGVAMTTPQGNAELLNEQGSVIFVTALASLSTIRPDIFLTPVYLPEEADTGAGAFDTTTTWEVEVGPQVTTAVTDAGTVFGMSGKNMAGFLVFGGYLLLSLMVVGLGGDAGIAAILSVPLLVWGTNTRILPFAFLASISILAILLLVYRFWWNRSG